MAPRSRWLYTPAGDVGYWQGAIREREDPFYDSLSAAAGGRARVPVDLLYGDHEGGQRTIARFGVAPSPEGDGLRAEAVRYWNVDGADPR